MPRNFKCGRRIKLDIYLNKSHLDYTWTELKRNDRFGRTAGVANMHRRLKGYSTT